ncbi:MAG: hypothetical protein QXW26_04740 [Candidatus Nitrosocaldus sp.]
MIIIAIDHDYGDVVYFITTSQKMYKADNVYDSIAAMLSAKSIAKYHDDYLMAGVVVNVWRYHLPDNAGEEILSKIKTKEVINIT